MNDSRTGNPTFGRPRHDQGIAFVSVRSRLWWVLWCVFAQVDCLRADNFTHTTIAANGNLTAGCSVTATYAQTTWVRKQGTTTWIQKNAGTSNLYTHNASTFVNGFATSTTYNGHSSSNTNLTYSAPAKTEVWEFTYTNGGTPAGAFSLYLPAQSFLVVYGGPNSSNYLGSLQTITVSVPASGGGQAIVTNPNEETTPPVVADYSKLSGKEVQVPFYVEAGVTNVQVEIGGQTLNFPVTTNDGDSGGIAMLNLPIPSNWNGTATINGQVVAVAPRLAYTGEPSMGVTFNPYQEIPDTTQPLNLAAGLSQAIPSRPSTSTESQYYGFPTGVTSGSKLDLPTGVTAVSQTAPVGNSLPTGVTYSNGSKTWTTNNYYQTASGTTTTTASSGSTTGTGSELTDEDKDAIGEQGAIGDYGQAEEAGQGLSSLGDKWDALKVKAQNKFGAFAPLQTGGLPKETVLAFNLPLGPYGSRSVSIDLTSPPFSTARDIALVCVYISAAWFFVRYIKV